jgi:argininosuccinate lyase
MTATAFPAPVYRDTVLGPLFENMKRHHWRQLMRINNAHAVMLAEQGLLTAAEAAAILGALDAIETDVASRLEEVGVGSSEEDLFCVIEDDLRRRLGIAVAGRLHTGRSRNDIDRTLFNLALRDKVLALSEALVLLIDGVIAVATRHRDTLVVAYTHGQPAQPTTWGHYLAALIEVLLRDVDRLSHALGMVDQSAMGAAAITTTGFPIDRKRMAELLGFARFQENAYGCIAAADCTVGVYAALKVMFLNIGRFVQDLNQWAGFEVGQLHIPDAFVQRSSIMPQKRNPVPIEHLRVMCSFGASCCDGVMLATHNTPFTDVNDTEHEAQEMGYGALDTAGRVVALLHGLLDVATINTAVVRRHIDQSYITITEVADSLVRSEGISFGQAHNICSELARHMGEQGQTLATVPYAVFAAAFTAAVERPPTLAEDEFRRIGTPEHFIAVRTQCGGPAPAPMDRSLSGYRDQLEIDRARVAGHQSRIEAAAAKLTDRVAHWRAAQPKT